MHNQDIERIVMVLEHLIEKTETELEGKKGMISINVSYRLNEQIKALETAKELLK